MDQEEQRQKDNRLLYNIIFGEDEPCTCPCHQGEPPCLQCVACALEHMDR